MSGESSSNEPKNPLGKAVEYDGKYQAELLFPICRQVKRDELGLKPDSQKALPFRGADIWNAYELSWLNLKGLPQVGIAEFIFPANSDNIIESKSFKLYLNSLNQSSFENRTALQAILEKDLSNAVGLYGINSRVVVKIRGVEEIDENMINSFRADCIDDQDIMIDQYDYTPSLLTLANCELSSAEIVQENLCSHLLKSNCLITNQPDWASVFIQYKGAKIRHEALLKYLVSFRTHNEFHEQCVERIFCDILKYCQPEELTVYARYTRRGGLDINPWRSNCVTSMDNIRLVRQ